MAKTQCPDHELCFAATTQLKTALFIELALFACLCINRGQKDTAKEEVGSLFVDEWDEDSSLATSGCQPVAAPSVSCLVAVCLSFTCSLACSFIRPSHFEPADLFFSCPWISGTHWSQCQIREQKYLANSQFVTRASRGWSTFYQRSNPISSICWLLISSVETNSTIWSKYEACAGIKSRMRIKF